MRFGESRCGEPLHPAIFHLVLAFLRRFHCRPGRKKEAIYRSPNPFLPSIVSGVLAVLFVVWAWLAVVAPIGRKPVPLRRRFSSITAMQSYLFDLLLLCCCCDLLILPTTRAQHMPSCLWTANQAHEIQVLPGLTIFRMVSVMRMYRKQRVEQVRYVKVRIEDVRRTVPDLVGRSDNHLDVVPRELKWTVLRLFGSRTSFLSFLGWLAFNLFSVPGNWWFAHNCRKSGHRQATVSIRIHKTLTV